jgi:hypothetical protein
VTAALNAVHAITINALKIVSEAAAALPPPPYDGGIAMQTSVFNLKLFCGDDIGRYKLSLPWRKDDRVFATNSEILFIGYAQDFPDVGQQEGNVPDVEALRIYDIDRYLPVCVNEIKRAVAGMQSADEHEKACSNCKGNGYIKGNRVIRKKFLRTPVLFRGVTFNLEHLSLIKDCMEFFGGEWLVSIRGALNIVVFKHTYAMIAVMPIRSC